MKKRYLLGFVVIALFLHPGWAASTQTLKVSIQSKSATSLDCAKARSGSEQVICSNPSLIDADKQMMSAYQDLLAQIDPHVQFSYERSLRDWEKARDIRCSRSTGISVCLEHEYKWQIANYKQEIAKLKFIADNTCTPQPLLKSLDKTVGAAGDTLMMTGKWPNTQGDMVPVFADMHEDWIYNARQMAPMKVLSWNSSTIVAQIPPNIEKGYYVVAITCKNESGTLKSPRGGHGFEIGKAFSRALIAPEEVFSPMMLLAAMCTTCALVFSIVFYQSIYRVISFIFFVVVGAWVTAILVSGLNLMIAVFSIGSRVLWTKNFAVITLLALSGGIVGAISHVVLYHGAKRHMAGPLKPRHFLWCILQLGIIVCLILTVYQMLRYGGGLHVTG